MLLSLLVTALAASFPDDGVPHAEATVDVVDDGAARRVAGAMHVGFDLTGPSPGLAARFDFGHRVSVEGLVFAGAPGPERLSWTGGGSIGLHVAPVRVHLGTRGTLDLKLGVGARATAAGGGSMTGGGFDLGGWGSGLLELAPDGTWSLYGGLLAVDPRGVDPAVNAGPGPVILPTAGVRFKLD